MKTRKKGHAPPTDVDMTTVTACSKAVSWTPATTTSTRHRPLRTTTSSSPADRRRNGVAEHAAHPAMSSSRLAARPHSYRRGSDGGATT